MCDNELILRFEESMGKVERRVPAVPLVSRDIVYL